jgi:hypothetical protein
MEQLNMASVVAMRRILKSPEGLTTIHRAS